MTILGEWRRLRARNRWPRRALPCLVPGSIFRTPRRALPSRRICRNRRSFNETAPSNVAAVHAAGKVAIETGDAAASCTTWETWFRVGPAIFMLATRNITAPSAGSISTRTCPIWLCRRLTTRTASFLSPCDSWRRTACRIKRPVGISGATTACLCRGPRSKTGWRPGGEKGGRPDGLQLSGLGTGRLLRLHRRR